VFLIWYNSYFYSHGVGAQLIFLNNIIHYISVSLFHFFLFTIPFFQFFFSLLYLVNYSSSIGINGIIVLELPLNIFKLSYFINPSFQTKKKKEKSFEAQKL